MHHTGVNKWAYTTLHFYTGCFQPSEVIVMNALFHVLLFFGIKEYCVQN